MRRTQIYLSEEQRAALTALAISKEENVSELIRDAIEQYILEHKATAQTRQNLRTRAFNKAFGMWKDSDTDFADIRSSAERI